MSGWLSQAIKSTNANNRTIASGTLDTSQKLTCFLKTATCRSIHLRCGRINIFEIAIKLFKKFWVICRSTSCVRSVIKLIITVTSVQVAPFVPPLRSAPPPPPPPSHPSSPPHTPPPPTTHHPPPPPHHTTPLHTTPHHTTPHHTTPHHPPTQTPSHTHTHTHTHTAVCLKRALVLRSGVCTMDLNGRLMADRATGAARRQRERRLRSWWQHERMSIACAPAEPLHLSSGTKLSTCDTRVVEGATNCALRGQNTVTRAREGEVRE